MSFAELKLSAPLCDALRRANYLSPTAIQAQAIPPALEGRDLVGIARTGTGKTAAYVLPLADHLAAIAANHRRPGSRHGRRVRALVLCPTRELALQVAEEAERITSGSRVQVLCVHGKVAVGPQVRALAAGVDLLIATPGRMIELLEAAAIHLDGVRHVVLDEADRMLDMGFEPQVRTILDHVPADRQTLLFTATFPPGVEAMASTYLRQPVRVEADPSATAAPHVRQWMASVGDRNKAPVVMALLAGLDRGGEPRSGVVVFTRTRRRAGWIVAALARHGFASEPIHGDRSHAQRLRALQRFAAGKSPVLVATDVAARGLHIEAVRTVVNYDVPLQPEEYVHRIGRASHGVQAARAGESFVLVDPDEMPAWRAIERTIGVRPEVVDVPDFSAFQAPWAAERDRSQARRAKTAPPPERPVKAATSRGPSRREDREKEKPRRSRKSRPVGKQQPGKGVRRGGS